jgi:D-tyrosyl-tRNA(Tyr) deacylase
MIAVIQRARDASVTIDGSVKSGIDHGLLVLVGIEDQDGHEDISWLAAKIVNLRIFDDEEGVMNRSCLDVNADILVISQFTLHASTRKGNRPSYIKAAKPDIAVPIYEDFVAELERLLGKKVGTGEFGAMMDVRLNNYGPVTIIIDTKNKK